MNIHTLIFVLVIIIPSCFYGQEIHEKMANEICKCAEKQNVKEIEGIEACMQNVLIDNAEKLMKFHKVKLMTDLSDDVFVDIGIKFSKKCDYAYGLIDDPVKEKIDTIKDSEPLKCSDIREGDYYYLTPVNIEQTKIDTTFVTITKTNFFERMKSGRTYSHLKIKWITDCQFDLEFIESNDPYKKLLSTPGEIYSYEIVGTSEDSVFLKLIYRKSEYHFEMIKI